MSECVCVCVCVNFARGIHHLLRAIGVARLLVDVFVSMSVCMCVCVCGGGVRACVCMFSGRPSVWSDGEK